MSEDELRNAYDSEVVDVELETARFVDPRNKDVSKVVDQSVQDHLEDAKASVNRARALRAEQVPIIDDEVGECVCWMW